MYCTTTNLIDDMSTAWTDYLSAILSISKVSGMAATKLFLNTNAPNGENQHSAPILCLLCATAAATHFCASCSLSHLCSECLSKVDFIDSRADTQQMHSAPGSGSHTPLPLYSDTSIDLLQQETLRTPPKPIRRRSSSAMLNSSRCLEDYLEAKSPETPM